MELLSSQSTRRRTRKFVDAFKAYCKAKNLPGGDSRVTDDPMEAAYFGVYVWKAAVRKSRFLRDFDKVIPNILGQKFSAPGG